MFPDAILFISVLCCVLLAGDVFQCYPFYVSFVMWDPIPGNNPDGSFRDRKLL
jgi:hypothetical protein